MGIKLHILVCMNANLAFSFKLQGLSESRDYYLINGHDYQKSFAVRIGIRLQGEEGKRSQGGQKKRYKDTLKASLKDFNIPIDSWEQAAQDRTKWRCLINKGASQFEEKRICEAERKRKERKARAKEPSSVSAQSEFTCSICNRQFRAKIGLYSHQRTHKHT